MPSNKKSLKLTKLIDETQYIPERAGNGVLKIQVSADEKGKVVRYSMSYINYRLCHIDNGRVLGYDNSHGYHHRHYMGKEEPIEFSSYEAVSEQFEKEWRALHEKAKKRYH